MKKTITLLFFCLFKSLTYSQEVDLKNTILIKPGYNLAYNNYSSRDRLTNSGYSFEVAFQRKLFQQLTAEVSYSFVDIENLPRELSLRGYRNDDFIDAFFRTTDIFLTGYEKQITHFLGLNLHYSFINNRKWFASFYAGFGYSWWDMNNVYFTGSTGNSIRWARTERKDSSIFSRFGFQVNYIINDRYVLGIQPSWTFTEPDFEFSQGFLYDPIDSFLNISLSLGYRFN